MLPIVSFVEVPWMTSVDLPYHPVTIPESLRTTKTTGVLCVVWVQIPHVFIVAKVALTPFGNDRRPKPAKIETILSY